MSIFGLNKYLVSVIWLLMITPGGHSRQNSLFVESIFHVGLASDSIMEPELATLVFTRPASGIPPGCCCCHCMAVVYSHQQDIITIKSSAAI